MKFFPEGPLPPFSISRVFQQWETQRRQPEHQEESPGVFFFWRVLTLFCVIPGFLACQFGFPMLFIVIDRQWPKLSENALGIIIFLLLALGFVTGFLLSKLVSKFVIWLELRAFMPTSSIDS